MSTINEQLYTLGKPGKTWRALAKGKVRALIGVFLLFPVAGSLAADSYSLVGDKDGFGLPGAPGVPAEGARWCGLGGEYWTDYRDSLDLANAAFTDTWLAACASPVSYRHAYSLSAAPISATLSIQEAGMADDRGPWYVVFDGTQIGQIGPFPGGDVDTIRLLRFAVPTTLLTGNDTIDLVYASPLVPEGYTINFSELSVTLVPEPGLVALGLACAASAAGARSRPPRVRPYPMPGC